MDRPSHQAALRTSQSEQTDLKTRIFAAFEHACRYGEVEVADQLLSIINSKWIKPSRASLRGPTVSARQTSAEH